jgi:hypothetical protein
MTATTIGKTDVLARIDQERAWWNGLLDEVGEERMERPGAAGDWTFKDVVAHLSGWQRRTLDRLAAGRDGRPAPPSPWSAALGKMEDDDDAKLERINAWFYERNKGRPTAEVVAESRRQWDDLREIVAGWSEADLNDPARLPWPGGGTLAESVLSGDLFGHFHEEHEPAIRAWMESLAK